MRISTKCSMALHILIVLALFTDQKRTGEKIAASVGCNPVMVRNLLSRLKEAGLVTTQRGSGGSELALPPEAISTWMVYEAVDSNHFDELFGIHPNPSQRCPVGKNIYSLLDKPYHEISQSMREKMEEITLQDLIDDYKTLRAS